MFQLLAVDYCQICGRSPEFVPSLFGPHRLLEIFRRNIHAAAFVFRIPEGQVCVWAMPTARIGMAAARSLSTGARTLRHSGPDHDLGVFHQVSNQICLLGAFVPNHALLFKAN